MQVDREAVTTQIGEYQTKRRTLGRYKRHGLKYVNRQLRLATTTYYQRFTAINPYLTANCGKIDIFNFLDTTNQAAYLPIRLFDLTSFSQSGATAPCGYEIRLAPSSATNVVVVQGTKADATAGTGYFAEDSTTATAVTARRANLKYCNIRLLLYGTISVPVKYEIGILRIKEDEYNPQFIVNEQAGASSNQKVFSFWEYMATKFAYNPIQVMDGQEHKRHYHYRPIKTFLMETTQTNEGSATIPHAQQFDIFYKKDRMYSFDWYNTAGLAQADIGGTAKWTSYGYNLLQSGPDYKYREYLMIRALTQNRSGAPPASFSKTTDPSFDILIRQKWEIPQQ